MVFGIDDAALAALAQMAGSAMQGAASASGSKSQARATKKAGKMSAQEEKRRTIADLLNKALGRELDLYKTNLDSQNAMRSRQAGNLMDMATGFRQSLFGGG